MKKIKNYFFIESPFQLLCAVQASRDKYPGVLVCRIHDNKNRDLIVKTLREYENSFIKIYLIENNLSNIFKFFLLLARMFSIYFFNKNECRFWLGDIRSTWMKFILNNNANIGLIDDGFSAINIFDNIDDIVKLKTRSKLLNFLFFLFRNKKGKKIHIYSIFKHSRVNEKHKFELLFNPNKLDLDKRRNRIFIGSGIVDIGLVNLDEYLTKIKKNMTNRREYNIYIPHRYESDFVVNAVRDLGIQIKYLDYPFEIAIINNELEISDLYGFFSSVLYTASIIDKSINVNLINIKTNSIPRESDFLNVRNYILNNSEINIVNI